MSKPPNFPGMPPIQNPAEHLDKLVALYREEVAKYYPGHLDQWPLLNHGKKVIESHSPEGWHLFVMHDRPHDASLNLSSGGRMSAGQIGGSLSRGTLEKVREHLESTHRLGPRDGVVLIEPGGANLQAELESLRRRHELALGLVKQRIFLSHKGANKPAVRDFKETLVALGFDLWLDEDAMVAGDELNRAILKGMKDSCAAVFFVTEDFKDERWIADEVDYAKDRKREDGDRFAIITIVRGGEKNVPELLKKYVYKSPRTDLDALREILRALPLGVGKVRARF